MFGYIVQRVLAAVPVMGFVALFVFLASSLSDHVTGQYVEANSLPDAMRIRSQ